LRLGRHGKGVEMGGGVGGQGGGGGRNLPDSRRWELREKGLGGWVRKGRGEGHSGGRNWNGRQCR